MPPRNSTVSRKNDIASTKTKGLQQETTDIETKLLELRRAMEAERIRRESIMTTATSGSLWRNGATGLLRSNFRSKQANPQPGQTKSGPSSSEPSSRTVSARTDPVAGMRAASGAGIPLPSSKPSGSETADGMTPQARAVVSQQRKVDILSVVHMEARASVDGMGCGTEADDNLAVGAFNEGDSHKSFLEALNEWRNGQKRVETTNEDERSVPSKFQGTEGASMEVQTDTNNRKARPLSAPSKRSYFEKLALNTASRQAGASATGSSDVGSVHQQSDVTKGSVSSSIGLASIDPEASILQQRFAMLDQLDRLEQEQADADLGERDDDDSEIVVTTQKASGGLVKGVHLPDAIQLPGYTSDSD